MRPLRRTIASFHPATGSVFLGLAEGLGMITY